MTSDFLLRRRAISAGIDAVILVLLYVVTYYSLAAAHIPHGEILAYANCYLETIVFPVFVWPGQSVGKKLTGLKTVVNGENPESRVMLFVRELCKSVLFTNINELALAIFVAFPLLNKRRLALHDVIAKTSVVPLSECGTKHNCNE